ncbi:MAG: hypothetical protein LJE92_04630 [Gammaproteobacteria bacterium]|jgi:hypothetical protein|nr:hypothetical protein [Gammaproteobacteria bacterium]
MIRRALSVLPTRPIVYIVPVLVVLVLSFYYRDIHQKCADNKQFRRALVELLHSVDRPGQFRLLDFTDFRWDKVRIVAKFEPERRNTECPFDWNWPSGVRDTLIANGLLTVLIFAQDGVIVKYHELRSDELAFRGTESSLTPQTAVFDVGRDSVGGGAVTLSLNQ